MNRLTALLLPGLLALHAAEAGTITVTSTADNGPGTLRAALANAADGDTIDATGVSGTIRLTSGELLVNRSLSITGPGSDALAVDGNAAGRVFNIGSNLVVNLSGLMITNGFVTDTNVPAYTGAGIYSHQATLSLAKCIITGNIALYTFNVQGSDQFYGMGGGIYNDQGRLALLRCVVSNNVAGRGSGGGNFTGHGGGIYNYRGTLSLSESVIEANSADDTGGGIVNDGYEATGSAVFTATNSSVTANWAGFSGGGILNWGGAATLVGCTLNANSAGDGNGGALDNEAGSALVADSTISSNSAAGTGGGIWNEVIFGGTASLDVVNSTFEGNSAGSGGAIANYIGGFGGSTTLTLGSTILDAGASGGTITSLSGTVISLGYNLSSDDGGGFLMATGDQINTNPLLGPLQDNGGSALTHALLPGSPAIDRGKNFSGAPFDQRGAPFFRTYDNPAVPNAPGGDGTDIGAFEAQPPPCLTTVTTTADSGPGSLRAALACASDGDTIDATGVSGIILLTSGELLVNQSLTIVGPGPARLAVDGNGASRVFHMSNAVLVSISGLTVTHGSAVGFGGGIFTEGDMVLTLSNCTVTENEAGGYGGGIFGGGMLMITDSTISLNYAGRGGGIFGGGVVVNSRLSQNSASWYGGGIYTGGTLMVTNSLFTDNRCGGDNGGLGGGGIFNYFGQNVSVVYSTFSFNSTTGFGGGIDNRGGTVTVANSTFSANSATYSGGGIENDPGGGPGAIFRISNSTLSGNTAGGGGGIGNDSYGGSATVVILNSTLSGNLGAGYGDSIYNLGTVELGSTILNTGPAGANLWGSGTVVSDGYNLSSDSAGGNLTQTTDRINTDPLLGPLQNNGGPTFTHALLCGSPAIDKGTNFTGVITDQRGVGFARSFDDAAVPDAAGGDGTDIGAFEVQRACNQPPVVKCRSVTVPAGTNCSATASIDNTSYDPDGDPLTVNQSPPGPYPLGTNAVTLTVTDSHGASSFCTALVIVRDAAAPQITCPADITVEFTDANGAAATFAPAAADECSGPPVVTCAPPSGSTFPIGTTKVLCTAMDSAGNAARCGFQITVLGPRGVKRNVLAEMTALRTSLGRAARDYGRELDEAIRFLAASFDARFWVDETHLKQAGGGLAMTEEGLAVRALQDLARAKRNPAPVGVLQGLIGRIVKSDRLLAVVAIQDATAAGVNSRRIERARAALAEGDAEAAAGRCAAAIEDYREAWSQVHGLP